MWKSIREIFRLEGKREIYRVYVSHTLRGIALSIVSVYVPVYLLTRGHSLTEVVLFYALLHGFGLVVALLVVPRLIERFGLIQTFKWNYPFEIGYYLFLALLPVLEIPIWPLALLGGMATFVYWVPLNILLMRHSQKETMGSDMANFFALPKLFTIVGPAAGGILIYSVGFWATFTVAMIGLLFSFLPIAPIQTRGIQVTFRFREAWQKLRRRKKLFLLEGMDNILEESDWVWGIYIYLLVGSLVVPGYIGSLEALGGAAFTFLAGKWANRSDRAMVIMTAVSLMALSALRMVVENITLIYGVTLVASFVMTAFLVSYFSFIYRSVKGDEEEEFLILREIPTVFARMVVFGGMLMTVAHPKYYFLLPLLVSGILLVIFLRRPRGDAVAR